MTGQPVRWPNVNPLILLGGCDVEGHGERYLHLGRWPRGAVVTVEHEHYGSVWKFRFRLWRVELRLRLSA